MAGGCREYNLIIGTDGATMLKEPAMSLFLFKGCAMPDRQWRSLNVEGRLVFLQADCTQGGAEGRYT